MNLRHFFKVGLNSESAHEEESSWITRRVVSKAALLSTRFMICVAAIAIAASHAAAFNSQWRSSLTRVVGMALRHQLSLYLRCHLMRRFD